MNEIYVVYKKDKGNHILYFSYSNDHYKMTDWWYAYKFKSLKNAQISIYRLCNRCNISDVNIWHFAKINMYTREVEEVRPPKLDRNLPYLQKNSLKIPEEFIGKQNLIRRGHNIFDISGDYGMCAAYKYGHIGDNNSEQLVFLFDLEDYDKIKRYEWYFDDCEHVVGYLRNARAPMNVSLHRLIMNPPSRVIVDHINGNPGDNRKSNLRIVTHRQNSYNRKINEGTKAKSLYTGVREYNTKKYGNKWKASITYEGERIMLGVFDTKVDAIIARIKAEDKYFGEYARKEEWINILDRIKKESKKDYNKAYSQLKDIIDKHYM